MTSGVKHDQDKADLSLIPLSGMEAEARAFMWGEKKYSRGNYKGGLESHRLIAAAMRHLAAWEQGEDADPESGGSHIGHARACLSMLLECQRLGTLKDTRYRATAAKLLINKTSGTDVGEEYRPHWALASGVSSGNIK